MMCLPVSFAIETDTAAEEAVLTLRARFPSQVGVARRSCSTYYDTFDWRLYDAGGTLAAQPVEGGLLLSWDSAAGSSALRLSSSAMLAFALELPEVPLREEVARIIEMRRLLPIVAVSTETRLFHLLGSLEKTVARVAVRHGTATDLSGESGERPLSIILRVLPVRGYDKDYEAVLRFVEKEIGLTRVESRELELALAAIHRSPCDYSSKLRLRLDPEMRADEAMKLIHRTLLSTMEANEEGARHDLDSEFLHDFRVAGRRTRSALRQIKGVYPQEVVDHFSDEFRWLGQITGPTRDLDVYLLKMADYEASLPAAVVGDLAPLVEFLCHLQQFEQRCLARHLEEERYRALVDSWREFLEQPSLSDTGLADAHRPIREVASERIWRAYRRVLSRGRAIASDTPAATLHRLRIDCKKLRYLLEFFRSLYDTEEIEGLVKALKRLQDNLGDFNDYEVQQESLRTSADRMVESGSVPAGTLMAMGRLVERLEAGQDEERRQFAKRFGQFATRKNHRLFKRLFKATRGTGARPLATVTVPDLEAPGVSPEAHPEEKTETSPDPQDQP